MYKSKTGSIPLVFLLAFCLSACAAAPPDLATARPGPTAANPPTALSASTGLPQSAPSLAQPVPEPVPTQKACSPAARRSGTVGAGLLDKPMDYLVLLPPCYAENTAQRYPVLYLLHGQNFTQNQWIELGLGQAAEDLMESGAIEPFLIVLPFDHSFKQPREYRFEQVFMDELLPAIDENYRSQPKRASRAIGGLSRGGAWAVYLASRHPQLFGIVGAHSPAIFYSNNSVLPVRLRDIPAAERPVFYVDAGGQDVDFKEIEQFTALLNRLGFAHEWHSNLGFHDQAYWSAHVEDYLRWYGSQFQASH
ncbi:MAG: alpha/beta hydrolase-fold protein [Anaerolineales bacterium]|nr:alpha/beta hydrolase-fold protein [Anaerolineales bacterium]